MQADAADAGKGRGKAQRQRELYTRPGLPSSAEEVSQMLGRPLPPAYVEVAYRPFQERDVRPKTRASHRKAGCRVKVERSAASASETPADPAPRREPRVPRVEEAENGEELVPLRTAESTEARTLVHSLAQRIGSLEDRMTRNDGD